MSGRVIFKPKSNHRCYPGWGQKPPLPEGNRLGLPAGTVTSAPPHGMDFPVGCRWQCDDCGQVWVRRKPPRTCGQQFVGGKVVFTKEHWWERRRRERAS